MMAELMIHANFAHKIIFTIARWNENTLLSKSVC